ncbi:MAG: Gldg family protein [Lachnospiraceae bacterium]|nr:Gldg family protein [Lachnospiraceae bacterium]
MTAVYKRELKSYFQSVTGCLFIAVNLLFIGIYFTAFNLSYGKPYISYAISSALFIFLVITPILTMRSFAEEKRQKTDQLLFTSPTSIGKIVIGKYLAMVTVFMIPVIIVCFYPLLLSMFGEVPFAESYVAILGYFLFGATSIAVGMFVSSLTESQIIASVGTFAILLVGYLMKGIEGIISSTGNWITKILDVFNIGSRLDNIMQGVFDINSIVYFLTVMILFQFFTYQSIQKRRYSISSKTMKLTAYSNSMVVAAIAIAVAFNFVVSELPSTYTQLDVTSGKIYSITDQTKEIAASLNEDVTIYVLSNEDNADSTVDQTLKKYEALSKHIKVVYKDPTVNPNFASQYNGDDATAGSLIVVSDRRSKVIAYNDLFETEMDYSTYQETPTGYDAEGQITSALSYVTSESMPKMYVINGHNEAEISSTLASSIAKENIDTMTINLMDYDAIPEDAECIFILSPTKDFSDDDTTKVKEYLKNGGKAFIISSYSQEKLKNFDSIMEDYQLTLADGLVVEADQGRYYENPYYLLPNIETSEITSSVVSNKQYIFTPYARGIVVPEEDQLRDGLTIEKLLTTSESSYAKSDVSNDSDYKKGEKDVDGPFAVGVYVEEASGEETTQIAYFTTENMMTDTVNETVAGSNYELVMSALGKMVDHEVSVSIPAKPYETQDLTIARSSLAILSFLTTIILPLLFLATGLIVWIRRRKV